MNNSLFRMLFLICLFVLLFIVSYSYHPYLEPADEEILVSDNAFVSNNNINYIEKEMGEKEVETQYSSDNNEVLTLNNLKKMVGVGNVLKDKQMNQSPITVAVLDSGIYPHQDLTSPDNRIIAFKDMVNGLEEPYDDNGHGTAIAGIIGGDGSQSSGKYSGIAPFVRFVAIKVLNFEGKASKKTLMDGINWVIENKERYNIKILNISIGLPTDGYDDIAALADKAYESGIFIVTSVGNGKEEVTQTMYSPAISPSVVAVGAIQESEYRNDTNYSVASFSSSWTSSEGVAKPDLVAPGYHILSLQSDIYYKGEGGYSSSLLYSPFSGTSMSAAVVSGVVALLMSEHPEMSLHQIRKEVLSNCINLKEGYRYLYLKGR